MGAQHVAHVADAAIWALQLAWQRRAQLGEAGEGANVGGSHSGLDRASRGHSATLAASARLQQQQQQLSLQTRMTALNASAARPEFAPAYAVDGELADEALHAGLGLGEREYGTFEVSFIDAEEAEEPPRKSRAARPARACGACAGDCALLLRVLLAPVRLDTYKCVAFHAANFAFAVLAAAWSAALQLAQALACWHAPWANALARVASASLRALLATDCRLVNFISRDRHAVAVYNSAAGFQQQAGFFGVYAQLYFLAAKLLLAALPGFLCALLFAWAWVHAALLVLRAGFGLGVGSDVGSGDGSGAVSARHALELEAAASAVALYACVLLLQVLAYASRAVTMFFCAEYLVYRHAA